MSVASNVESDIYTLRRGDSGIDLVPQPIFRNLLLNHMHVIGIFRPEIAAAPGDSESTLGAACTESSVRPADRPAFAKSNLIALFFRRSLGLLLGGRLLLLLRLCLCVLALDLNCIWFFLFDLRLRLRYAFRFVGQHVLALRRIRW